MTTLTIGIGLWLLFNIAVAWWCDWMTLPANGCDGRAV